VYVLIKKTYEWTDQEESSNLQGKMECQHLICCYHDFSKKFKNGTTDYRPN
jgi:hypothetical protein